jgi:CheY-like chemotaxis protein
VRRLRDYRDWLNRANLVSRLRLCARVLHRVRASCKRSARGVIESPSRTKPLVLIVEDDPWIRAISSELLEDEGFAVASAGDGPAGLDMVERLRPAVILLDLGLPHMSGTEFLERLRGRASLGDTPVIVISGQPEEFSRDATALADGFLRKPVDLTELMQQIQAATAVATPAGCAVGA